MTYYWITVDGVRAEKFAHPDRLTTLEKTLWASKYASENNVPFRGVAIKEVGRKLYEVVA